MICVLTFDRPGSAANFFDRQTLEEFGAELEYVASEASSLRGLVIASAKPSILLLERICVLAAHRRGSAGL